MKLHALNWGWKLVADQFHWRYALRVYAVCPFLPHIHAPAHVCAMCAHPPTYTFFVHGDGPLYAPPLFPSHAVVVVHRHLLPTCPHHYRGFGFSTPRKRLTYR